MEKYPGRPARKRSPFREWSPSIHYAQTQTMSPGKLGWRRLYDFELLYVSQGTAVTSTPAGSYTIEAGQLIFLPPGALHRNEVVSEPFAKFIGIHFDFFDELEVQSETDMVVDEENVQAGKFAVEAVAEEFAPLSDNPVYTPGQTCVGLMEQLVLEFAMRSPGYELACKSLMLGILSYLLRSQLPRRIANASVHGARIAKLMEAVEAEPERDWSNRELAARMNVHEDHMAKLFKQIAGKSPRDFIAAVRHREARRYLRETDLPIEEIGGRVGYEDLHYFSRVFKRHEGISPREYRKLSRIL